MQKLLSKISVNNGKPGIADFTLLLFLIIYPYNVKISLIFLTLHFLFTIQSNFRGLIFNLKKEALLVAACILFYLLHVISLSYSFNFHSGLKDVETKFGFFIFPLLALMLPRTNDQRTKFLKYFVISFSLSAIICIIRSFLYFIVTSDTTALFYDQFSYLMHPTYYTMHLAVALIFHLYLSYAESSPGNYINSGKLKISIVCILLIAIFLTSSRAGIVIALLSAVLLLSGKVISMVKIPTQAKLTFIVVSLAMMILMLFGSSRFSLIFNEITGNTHSSTENVHSTVDENPVAHRFTLMKVAAKVALNHPIGVGAGDVQDILVEEYKQIGYEKAVIVRYNPHNQYLQTAVAVGFPGLIALVMLFGALFWSVQSPGQGKLLFFVGLILALNGLFESVFEVQRGVLLLTIMVAFIFRMERQEKSIKS